MTVDIRQQGDEIVVTTYNQVSGGRSYTFNLTVNNRWKLTQKGNSTDVQNSDITSAVRKAMEANDHEIGQQSEREVWSKWNQPVAPVNVCGQEFVVTEVGERRQYDAGEHQIFTTDRGDIALKPKMADGIEVGETYVVKDNGSARTGSIHKRNLSIEQRQ